MAKPTNTSADLPDPNSGQPEPAPGGAMTEPSASQPAPVTSAPAEPAQPEPAQAEPSTQASGSPGEAASAETVSAAAAAAWPDNASEPTDPRCPWCSATLPSADLATCPSCGAQLNGPVDGDVPGVTTIDVSALAWKAGAPPRRNKLMSWISGDVDDETDSSKVSPGAVEPPSLAVRREILRLELEAEGITLPHDAEPSEDDESSAGVEVEGGSEAATAADAPPAGEAAPAADTQGPASGSTGS
jgi:hypothetical protein